MNAAAQFRVLYRHFLFRLTDVELLAESARGDSSTLLGQFGALLVFGSLLQSVVAVTVGQALRHRATDEWAWTAERLLISLAMLVAGVFALLNWESTFPDRRDALALGPLPIRPRTLFAAKVAAAVTALGVTLAAWNCLAGFAWPPMLAPTDAGLAAGLRYIAAYWIAIFAAGTFVYCSVLAVEGATAQLPARLRRRVSPFVQSGAFALLLGAVCFQPSFNTAAALSSGGNQTVLRWLPAYWFLGLFHELAGSLTADGNRAMLPLVGRAIASLPAAVLFAGAAFLLAYLRTMRQSLEEPDIAPITRGWTPRAASRPATALLLFIVRTLTRSRRHRSIVTFYLGAGVAIAAVYLQGARDMQRISWLDLARRVDPLMLTPTILLLCASWLGVRTAFSIPLDLRSNWIFRIAPAPNAGKRLRAVRDALLLLSVAPVLAVSAGLLLAWPWTAALGHLLALALTGCILTDLSLRGFRKIPFTCSYLPGKSRVHMTFWFGAIPAIILIHEAARVEAGTFSSPASYLALIASLTAGALAARVASERSAALTQAEPQFDEPAPDELIGLHLDQLT